MRVVDRADVDAFASGHASVLALAEEMGLSASAVRHWLAVGGIEPAFPIPEKGSAVYRRGDLPPGPPAGAAARPLSAHEVARRLGLDTASAAALLSDGLLPFRTVPGPVSGKPVRVVSEAALEAFEAEFVTLKALAREHGLSTTKLRLRLLAAGVEPASGRKGCQGVAYRRADVPPGIGKDAAERRLLSVADARRRIGVGEDVIHALVEGGAVAAVTTHVAVDGRQVRVVSAEDLDRLASLDALARERMAPADLLRSSFERVGVEPIFSGGSRAEAVYRRRDLPDATFPGEAASGALPLAAVAMELGMSVGKVRELVALGLIRSQPLLADRGRAPKHVVLRSELAAFKDGHVTLGEIARAWGSPSTIVSKCLAVAGVTPLHGMRRHRLVLYRRCEVDACEAMGTTRPSRPAASTGGRPAESSQGRGGP